ncbi:hypothetical protein KL86DES1_21380 [uncultured Desulfovibrio sp.]|uniref:Uncharacterized protein n=1 Tax=uncultured Desulfovibrio sp. TaxID=167968 RepID=A0A212L7S9_9BACT|nr:hypothetical protein KL86DES1_21380 [uncultured Desulfovibrio sp.]VZH34278.1 conserved protein of unknown function [Desulfovibrio sp. 86]
MLVCKFVIAVLNLKMLLIATLYSTTGRISCDKNVSATQS